MMGSSVNNLIYIPYPTFIPIVLIKYNCRFYYVNF